MYCIWVSRDPEEQGEGSRMANQMLLAGSFNSTLNMSNGYFSDVSNLFLALSFGFNSI